MSPCCGVYPRPAGRVISNAHATISCWFRGSRASRLPDCGVSQPPTAQTLRITRRNLISCNVSSGIPSNSSAAGTHLCPQSHLPTESETELPEAPLLAQWLPLTRQDLSTPVVMAGTEAEYHDRLRSLKSELAAMANVPESSVMVVFSPYRICPLGAHIDHQGGPVTAMALDFGVTLAFVLHASPTVRLMSKQYKGTSTFRLDQKLQAMRASSSIHQMKLAASVKGSAGTESALAHRDTSKGMGERARSQEEDAEEEKSWGDYARGAAWALLEAGYQLEHGIIGVVAGEEGVDCSGISSSAAVGVAYLLAFAAANGISLSEEQLIQLDRRIENGFLGLNNGILDQSAIVLSRKGQLTLIRCREMVHVTIPFGGERAATDSSQTVPCDLNFSQPEGGKRFQHEECDCGRYSSSHCGSHQRNGPTNLPFTILLAFSGVTGALTSTGGYNMRVAECREAAALLHQNWLERTSNVDATDAVQASVLGDLSPELFEQFGVRLPENLKRRARHFFSECQRVEDGIQYWQEGDIVSFGKCMSESGQSSIENYECGIQPMVELRRVLLNAPGILGARFSGAGFRGCCVALVWTCMADKAAAYVIEEYRKLQPEHFQNVCGQPVVLCGSGDGARILP